MMKTRVKDFVSRLVMAVRQHPMEVLMAVFYSCLGCLYVTYRWKEAEDMMAYFPVCFLATYTLNLRLPSGAKRIAYYLSAFAGLLFWWVEAEVPSVTWGVSLVVIQLLYLISFWLRENDAFIERLLCYAHSAVFAGALTFVAWILSISIYYSIRYIFEIWEGPEERFITRLSSIAGFGVLPLLFMMFNQDQRFSKGIRVSDILVNYILSPALLIYAAILYLYFIKIAVTWSLPKGGIAYIVVSFTAVTFLLKGVRPFLGKQHFEWFYNWASVIVMPALAMYWVGSVYRINQYGFTEPRVYLIVVGLILTVTALLFFSKQCGRYLYAAAFAVILLSAVTYIPGINAKDIERMSQAGRPPSSETDDSFLHDGVVLDIENTEPTDITGYTKMQVVEKYRRAGHMWMRNTNDSLFVYTETDDRIYAESLRVFLDKQFAQAGIAGSDTIPEAAIPQLLRLQLPDGVLVFDRINLSRDSTFTLSYTENGYYLEK